MKIHTTQLVVTPKPWKGRTAAAVTVYSDNPTWDPTLRNYTRVMCPRWFKRIFGFDVPTERTVVTISVYNPRQELSLAILKRLAREEKRRAG